jgi:hypothetical protein
MNATDNSSRRASAVLFLSIGMMIIAFACWELFTQTEQRDERQHAQAEMADTSPPADTLRSDPHSLGNALPQKKAPVAPASLLPGASVHSPNWKQLKGRALKVIEMSIPRTHEVSATFDPPSTVPKK